VVLSAVGVSHPQTIGAALADATAILRAADVPGARLDALLLLGEVAGATRTELLAHPERALDPARRAALGALVARRAAREPLAYIVGHREFYGRDFLVSPAVLVPRPETELLVELSLVYLRTSGRTSERPGGVVDVGTGSGALAVTLAAECPALRVLALDRSAAALAVARANGRRWQVAPRVDLLQSDLLGAVRAPLALIVANLPYIPSAAVDALMPEVARHEPRLALDGGVDGLAPNRRLLAEAATRLTAGGLLLLEMGADQAAALVAAAHSVFAEADVAVERDLAGCDRVLRVRRRG
jgi:release factor glutamine methyltransferase